MIPKNQFPIIRKVVQGFYFIFSNIGSFSLTLGTNENGHLLTLK